MAIYIRLKQFDGPMDLLLHLIGKAKIDIKDIFVSEITEQFIEAVKNAPDFDMDAASEFVAMRTRRWICVWTHRRAKPPPNTLRTSPCRNSGAF